MSKSRDLADLPAGGGDINVDGGTLFVDASTNNVGIGTTSPSAVLETFGGNSFIGAKFKGYTGGKTAIVGGDLNSTWFGDDDSSIGQTNCVIVRGASNEIRFNTNASEAARIDSSGNLLVGTTDTNPVNDAEDTFAFVVNKDNHEVRIRSHDLNSIEINRTGTDDSMIAFSKDGSTVGAIGTGDGSAVLLTIHNTSSGIGFYGNGFAPTDGNGAAVDNAKDVGAASYRFDDVYATNGTIQTSDRNDKQDIEELSEAEQRVAVACKGLLRKWRWKSAVEEKGDDARIHFGIIAQDLQAAFETEGLDAGRYGMFMYNEWWETYTDVPAVEAQDAVYETVTDEDGNETQALVSEAVEAKEAYTRTDTYETEEEAPEGAVKKSRMGVRYSELLAFIIAAI